MDTNKVSIHVQTKTRTSIILPLSQRMNCTVGMQRFGTDCEQRSKLKNVRTRDQYCHVRQSIHPPKPLGGKKKTVRRQLVGEDGYSTRLQYVPIPSVHP
jgi:hypothetical protein